MRHHLQKYILKFFYCFAFTEQFKVNDVGMSLKFTCFTVFIIFLLVITWSVCFAEYLMDFESRAKLF